MALYRYVKAQPDVFKKQPFFLQRREYSGKLSVTFMVLGVSLLLWTFWPIVSFTIFMAPLMTKIISPVAEVQTKLSPLVLAAGQNTPDGDTSTNANSWYPTKPQKKVVSPVTTYTLSIPKLKIKDATVIIGGDDLKKSLIHYGGTSLPGEYGTAVVFGHSTLPQFYNPTDYNTIFSTLPTLQRGDEILVSYDGVDYRYVIIEMTVTDPTDLSSLEQQFDNSYITLITCVPPGTTWKRLNVKAKLVKLPS